MYESAPQKIFAKDSHFLVGQVHSAGFHDVCVGVFEEIGIRNSDHVRIRKHAEICQALNTTHVLAVGARAVHGPSHSLSGKPPAASEFWTPEVFGNEPAKTAIAVFGIGEASEVKLHSIIRRSVCHDEHRNETNNHDDRKS